MFSIQELLKAGSGKLTSGSLKAKVSGVSIDSRTIKPGEAFIAIKGNNFDGHDFIAQVIEKGAACIICERSQPIAGKGRIAVIQVRNTVKALGDIARYRRSKFDIPVIAITGSNGKTTTKDMAAWILSSGMKVLFSEGTKNNHIGLPMALLGLKDEHRAAILELGTNHPGEIGYLSGICKPNIGIITNIGPSHLEFLLSLKGVFKEKVSLFDNLSQPAIAIVNADDVLLKKLAVQKPHKAAIFSFGIKSAADINGSRIRLRGANVEFRVNEKYPFALNTPGVYNIYNALAAIACARLLGMDYAKIAQRLSVFSFPQGRLRLIEINSLKFIDDTYNSNPLSLGAALEALEKSDSPGRKILVMGDMLELGSRARSFHRSAGKRIARSCDCLIAVGEFSGLAAEAARLNGLAKGNIFTCVDSASARDILLNEVAASRDDLILVKGSRSMKMEEVLKI